MLLAIILLAALLLPVLLSYFNHMFSWTSLPYYTIIICTLFATLLPEVVEIRDPGCNWRDFWGQRTLLADRSGKGPLGSGVNYNFLRLFPAVTAGIFRAAEIGSPKLYEFLETWLSGTNRFRMEFRLVYVSIDPLSFSGLSPSVTFYHAAAPTLIFFVKNVFNSILPTSWMGILARQDDTFTMQCF